MSNVDPSYPWPNKGAQMMTDVATADEEKGLSEWREQYDEAINNPPTKGGEILTSLVAGDKVLLHVECLPGAPPFIFGRVYVPEVVGQPVGWFCQSNENQNFHGWKCIILPRARTELIRRYGLKSETMEVQSLKVIRPSQSGKSILCEVHRYDDENDRAEGETETSVVSDKTETSVVPNKTETSVIPGKTETEKEE